MKRIDSFARVVLSMSLAYCCLFVFLWAVLYFRKLLYRINVFDIFLAFGLMAVPGVIAVLIYDLSAGKVRSIWRRVILYFVAAVVSAILLFVLSAHIFGGGAK